MALTEEEHKKRHVELHARMDELFADFIYHHPDEHSFLDIPYRRIMEWSFEQTKNPTPLNNEK